MIYVKGKTKLNGEMLFYKRRSEFIACCWVNGSALMSTEFLNDVARFIFHLLIAFHSFISNITTVRVRN